MKKSNGKLDRRSILALLTAGTAGELFVGSSTSAKAVTLDRPREVIVVGGGMAGTTAAKYLKLWGAAAVSPLNVTLIISDPKYTSNIMSNKVLTGQKTLAELEYGYDGLVALGVNIVIGQVGSVDAVGKKVILSSGSFGDSAEKSYDRLILAPGVDFVYKSFTGTTNDAIQFVNMTAEQAPDLLPHAWKAGPSTENLRNQLLALTNGNNVIITIPKAPYRCPPGPYERVCVVAEWLRNNKPASKLIVLDENPKVIVEPLSFGNAFSKTYASNVSYYSGASLASVTYNSAQDKSVTLRNAVQLTDALTNTKSGPAISQFSAEILNLIPQQQAGKIVIDTLQDKLDASGRWAPVDELSYEVKGLSAVHVIGDAISSAQPKAGHIGNQEAKICADAILRMEFTPVGAPYAKPVTNSACYTPISTTTATWLTAVFAYDTNLQKMVLVDPPGVVEPSGGVPTTSAYSQMNKWFAGLMEDAFG